MKYALIILTLFAATSCDRPSPTVRPEHIREKAKEVRVSRYYLSVETEAGKVALLKHDLEKAESDLDRLKVKAKSEGMADSDIELEERYGTISGERSEKMRREMDQERQEWLDGIEKRKRALERSDH